MYYQKERKKGAPRKCRVSRRGYSTQPGKIGHDANPTFEKLQGLENNTSNANANE